MLSDRFLPIELGERLRAYPFFLILFIAVFFVVTCLVEFLYGRKIVRVCELRVERGSLVKGVILANVASYAVLGPLFYAVEYPRTGGREFTDDTRWARQPVLTVVAVGSGGHLEAATTDGRNRRVVVPHEVRDFVVSADLAM